MSKSDEWKKFLDESGITEAFLPGDDFQKWLAKENEKLRVILTEVGLIKK